MTSSAGDDAERLIEIAHESLFRVWDRLVEWLDEAREFLRWRNRFQGPVEQWLSAEKRSDALLVGAALTAAEAWRRERADGLSEKEREFIDRSVLQRTRMERRRRFAMYVSLAAAASFLALFKIWAI